MGRTIRVFAGALALAAASTALVFPGSGHAAQVRSRAHRHTGKTVLQMLSIINADRHAAGLRSLSLDHAASKVARAHSLDMASHNYFSHYTPSGASPFDRLVRAGIHYRMAGENLGYDQGASRTDMLYAIEKAMLNSPEHRANLLRAGFTHVGIGVATSRGVLYVTEDFTG